MRYVHSAAVVAALSLAVFGKDAAAVAITNPGFEDTTGQSPYNEFTFGTPAGWSVHNPNGLDLTPGSGVYLGTLEPDGSVFFSETAPEGDRVAILFNAGLEGEGEYGFVQTLAETLQADTQYTLTVAVGNIASGTADDGTFYNLSGFPGYRIDLLAGGAVVASDDNTLSIDEGEFATSTIVFTPNALHPQLGQALGIRLVNLNVIPDGYTQETSPDLEVDFDDVQLVAQPIPEPASLVVACGTLLLATMRRR